MLLVIEPICFQEQHRSFNKRFLERIRELSIEKKFAWCGDADYGKEILEASESNFAIRYQIGYSVKEIFRRYYNIYKAVNRSGDAVDTIIFLSIDNTIFPIFSFIFKQIFKNKRVVVIIHNNLFSLEKSFFKKYLFSWASRGQNLQYVILGNHLKELSDRILGSICLVVNHPFYESLYKENKMDYTKNIKHFLIIGRQAIEFCNSGDCQKLVNYLKDAQNESIVRITIVTPAPIKNIPKSRSQVQITVKVGMIPEDEYIMHFNQTNFVLFPHSNEYDYRASGTLIDTLSCRKIFIAPKKGHFKEFNGCGIFYQAGCLEGAISEALTLSEARREVFIREINNKVRAKNSEQLSQLKELFR